MYFPFDEMTHNIVVGPQLNGTAVGSPVLVPGVRGQALSLDGVSQHVRYGIFRWVNAKKSSKQDLNPKTNRC